MGKQTKKQIHILKSLNLSTKMDKLNKQIESIFPKQQLNDLIIDKLKEVKQLQNNIKADYLESKKKRGKHDSFSKYLSPIVFKGYTREKFVIRRY